MRLRRLWAATTPVPEETRAALARRWAELSPHARTPAQTLGRHALGCEGTHGVFPRCNLACTPCYHSRDANKVATDGAHTLARVREQMALLRSRRGPHAHAQLIGGEVTLLTPDDHAAALLAMRAAGREPMSMTHGDVDASYLQALVTGPDGRRRLDRVSFAGHFDMMVFGRRGIPRPPDEASLHPYRARFAADVRALRASHGVRSFLAHNMTVTPRNVDQLAGVVRAVREMGYGLLSFQPAALVGDDRRWHEDYSSAEGDRVWAEVERGAGTRLPYSVIQHGDPRCNRTTYGFYLGPRYFPLLDDTEPRDLAVRDCFFTHLGGVQFASVPPFRLALTVARVLAAHPSVAGHFGAWIGRAVRRTGVRALLTHRVRPTTFVMHSFMDAADVGPAWARMGRDEAAPDARGQETQERLGACSYAMAHPETGELVPACVQHSVLDPAANATLARELPLRGPRSDTLRGPRSETLRETDRRLLPLTVARA